MKLSASQRNSLKVATSKYHNALSESRGAQYLEERGLPLEMISRFRLGFVAEPEVGHERYRNRLAIPYLRRSAAGEWSVVSMKFRAIPDLSCSESNKKYLGLSGDSDRLFNTVDAVLSEDWIAITEGEIDALTASAYGIPAVGVSGATKWKDHWTEIFLGYQMVYILADGDKAGMDFADMVAGKLRGAPVAVIPMDDDEDVNSMISKYGVDKVLERMGRPSNEQAQ